MIDQTQGYHVDFWDDADASVSCILNNSFNVIFGIDESFLLEYVSTFFSKLGCVFQFERKAL